MADSTFQASIVTPESVLLETQANFAVVPADDGLLGVLTHHAPFITRMKPGVLKLTSPDGVYRFAVTGGYAQMQDNILTVLTDDAIAESAVNAELISAEDTKAQAMPSETDLQTRKRKAALARVEALRALAAIGDE